MANNQAKAVNVKQLWKFNSLHLRIQCLQKTTTKQRHIYAYLGRIFSQSHQQDSSIHVADCGLHTLR